MIRTVVPTIASVVITWLCAHFNIILDEKSSTQAITAMTGIILCLYYASIRLLELKFPVFGILLGTRAQPAYNKKNSIEHDVKNEDTSISD